MIKMSVLTITKDNFKQEVLEKKGSVLLDFWADWCGPCKMFSPVIDKIAQENDNVTVGKVNVDSEPELAQSFKIQSIPTSVIIKDGVVSKVLVGLKSKAEIENLL